MHVGNKDRAVASRGVQGLGHGRLDRSEGTEFYVPYPDSHVDAMTANRREVRTSLASAGSEAGRQYQEVQRWIWALEVAARSFALRARGWGAPARWNSPARVAASSSTGATRFASRRRRRRFAPRPAPK